jgi:ribosome-binding factor A
MASEARARRLGERIREELAELLQREVADPRLSLVSVTEVEVDREFSVATVYFSALDASTGATPNQRVDEILEAFRRARGFLRHELVGRIPVRTFPQLRFRHDPSAERGAHIEHLIDSLRKPSRPVKTRKRKSGAG